MWLHFIPVRLFISLSVYILMFYMDSIHIVNKHSDSMHHFGVPPENKMGLGNFKLPKPTN